MNECDVQYRGSKNQRLLVELTLMKMCALYKMPSAEAAKQVAEKKNTNSGSLNPASTPTFEVPTIERVVPIVEPKSTLPPSIASQGVEGEFRKEQIERSPKSGFNSVAKTIPLAGRASVRIGGVRINGREEKVDAPESDPNLLPKDSFSEQEMQRIWSERVQLLFGKQPSLLSSLTKRPPRLMDVHLIELTLDSEHELEKVNLNKTALLDIIRKDLNNYSVQLSTPIEEVVTGKKAYTPKEKYEKMLDQNPHLDMLRQKFGLELDM